MRESVISSPKRHKTLLSPNSKKSKLSQQGSHKKLPTNSSMSNLKLMVFPTDQRQSIVSNSKSSMLSPNRH